MALKNCPLCALLSLHYRLIPPFPHVSSLAFALILPFFAAYLPPFSQRKTDDGREKARERARERERELEKERKVKKRRPEKRAERILSLFPLQTKFKPSLSLEFSKEGLLLRITTKEKTFSESLADINRALTMMFLKGAPSFSET